MFDIRISKHKKMLHNSKDLPESGSVFQAALSRLSYDFNITYPTVLATQ